VTAPFGAALAEALPRLRRYAIALAGDVATADDLSQDCMESGPGRTRPPSPTRGPFFHQVSSEGGAVSSTTNRQQPWGQKDESTDGIFRAACKTKAAAQEITDFLLRAKKRKMPSMTGPEGYLLK
jgi:hypothetical protein